jgi:hypothetical protein
VLFVSCSRRLVRIRRYAASGLRWPARTVIGRRIIGKYIRDIPKHSSTNLGMICCRSSCSATTIAVYVAFIFPVFVWLALRLHDAHASVMVLFINRVISTSGRLSQRPCSFLQYSHSSLKCRTEFSWVSTSAFILVTISCPISLTLASFSPPILFRASVKYS